MKPDAIVTEIEALAAHYIRPVRSAEEHERWLKDYVEDLKRYPEEALKQACANWRANDKNGKFPSPGQLMALVRQFTDARQPTGVKLEPWRELAPVEYEALTLAAKLRYHEIAGMEARKKAGPLWWNGRPCTLEDLSEDRADRWRTWTAEAARHRDDADRIRQLLARHERRA